jgi:hypothetical protein
MKDDWRAYDWPKNQVKRIDKEISDSRELIVENSKAIDTVSEELAGTDKAVATLESRLSRIERELRGEIGSLKMNIGLDDPEDEDLDTPVLVWLGKLEDQVRVIAASESFEQRRMMRQRVAKLEQRLQRDAGDGMAQNWEDWAEQQFNKWAAALHELQHEAIVDRERMARIEGQTHFETSEDNDRIKALEETIRRLVNRLEQAEQRLNAYGVPEARITNVEQMFSTRVVADEAAANGDNQMSFGHPVPGEAETMKRITGVQEMRREAFNRGFSAGRDRALEDVARSLRLHMQGSFSEGTINDLLRVIGANVDLPRVTGPN